MTVTPAQHTVPPPHDLDAEESIIGAMMISPRAIDAVSEIIEASDFYRASHTKIYRAALGLHKLGQLVDEITVSARLVETGELDEVGGKERVHALAVLVPAASNAAHWARLVAKYARRRRLVEMGEQIERLGRDGTGTSDDPDTLEQLARELITRLDDQPLRRTAKIATLDEFTTTHEEKSEALSGSDDETLLPAGGLLIMGGEGGASKTTLTLDAIAHLASGTPWLGYTTSRPVRVLIVENEGPRPQFREKLRDKLDTWRGKPWAQNVHVWEEPWAQFNFSRDADRRQLRDAAAAYNVDLVVADPLDSLGVLGAGTPEDTRTFIQWLRECGLHDPDKPLAFWLLHHFNKSVQRSVVAQLSGAWGGHPDAIIGVELGDGQTTKLTWGKLRHATPPKDKTIVLVWDIDGRGFHPVDKPQSADSQLVERAILDHVKALPGHSRSMVEDAIHELLNRTEKVSRKQIRVTVDRLSNPTETSPAQLAIRRGESPNGRYLFLASQANSPLAEPLFGEHGELEYHSEDVNGLNTELAARHTPDGEHGELENQTPSATRSEELAASKEGTPLRGSLRFGELPETPDPQALATSNGKAPTSKQSAEAWVRDTGWMTTPILDKLIQKFPTLTAQDYEALAELAESLAAAESHGDDGHAEGPS